VRRLAAAFHRVLGILAVSAVLPCFPARAQVELPPSPRCEVPAALTHTRHPLSHLARRLAQGGPVTIVAIGSSSTAGYAASTPAASYPSRLEAELTTALPGVPIRVLNKGISGEDATQMIARFDRDVLAEHPDLTIWQFGTNAVVRGQQADASWHEALRDGIAKLKASGTDVVLMDLQVAPTVTASPGHEAMLREIAAVARAAQIDVVRRYAIMTSWLIHDQFTLGTMLAPDGLHMNDASYACLGDAVARFVLDGVAPPPVATTIARR
jgi:lysophospholipase L1-like esterase